MHQNARRRARSRGSVTAETAAVLPALMVVLAAALWAVGAVEAHLKCVDAARAGARAAARGEPLDQVRSRVSNAAPPGASVEINREAGTTRVEVSAPIKPPWGPTLPAVDVSATAVSATEPGAEEAGSSLP
ncbi:TadE family type IV pilus minor pilin [Nonomuraea sp. NPDC046570]|uniref:TadE family type IV pilus minor pilin n=1 Tax=Nonomuraea sp. NPDC046570 TaxID=3155255 RepID=UPI0033D06431